jgi:hypothetical protein
MVKGLSCVFHAKKDYIKTTLHVKTVIFVVSIHDFVHVTGKKVKYCCSVMDLFTRSFHPHASAPLYVPMMSSTPCSLTCALELDYKKVDI